MDSVIVLNMLKEHIGNQQQKSKVFFFTILLVQYGTSGARKIPFF